MALSNDDILNAIADMSVMDVVELVSAMEEKFGVTASAIAPVAGEVSESEVVPSEQTEFDVILTSFGEKKVAVIKVVRSITGMGLKDAKDLVESVPVTIKEAISKIESEDIKSQLEGVGASLNVK